MTEPTSGLGDLLFIGGFWLVAAIALACGIFGIFVIVSAFRRKDEGRAD